MKHLILISILLLSSSIFASVIYVPEDYGTIQEAIDAATDADLVLVADGTYYENIDFLGKGVIVSSYYMQDGDVEHVNNTIIDGSQYEDIERAACAHFTSGETRSSVLIGFTLTGGVGATYDLANLGPTFEGLTQEGGGVFIDSSSPTIRYNIIIDNHVPLPNGYDYYGGGGISSFTGNPLIECNYVIHNSAGYACGIVLNWSGGIIRNNLVYDNFGGEIEGAGGIMVWRSGDYPQYVLNNTIVSNHSDDICGGILFYDTDAIVDNNIVYGNTQASGYQVMGTSWDNFQYNLVEGMNLPNNISANPHLISNFLLGDGSPCIDAGNPDVQYDDTEDPMNHGSALFPSMGNLRNDIGMWGGPSTAQPLSFSYEILDHPDAIVFTPDCHVGESVSVQIPIENLGMRNWNLVDINVDNSEIAIDGNTFNNTLDPFENGVINLTWFPTEPGDMIAELTISHNFLTLGNPIIIELTGTALAQAAGDNTVPAVNRLCQNHPNPFNPQTTIAFDLAKPSHVAIDIFNIRGRLVETLTSQRYASGHHEVEWDAGEAASGVYFYRWTIDGKAGSMRKCVLLK